MFDLCHIDTTDGLLPAICVAKGKPAPAYYMAKGVAKRKLNDATAELPFRAALREVTLKAMLQKIESAFPKTFTAVSTEGAKVEDSATFFEERKAEIVTFVQEFRVTLNAH